MPRRRLSRAAKVLIGVGVSLVVLLLASLVIGQTIFRRYWVPSASMEPTIDSGDQVWVYNWAYRSDDPGRGDIIVHRLPADATTSTDSFRGASVVIKRVIAVEGDTIEARDDGVYVNGKRVEEGYLDPGVRTDNIPLQTVPADHVFVMGDNRDNSTDSRTYGPIEDDLMVGRVMR